MNTNGKSLLHPLEKLKLTMPTWVGINGRCCYLWVEEKTAKAFGAHSMGLLHDLQFYTPRGQQNPHPHWYTSNLATKAFAEQRRFLYIPVVTRRFVKPDSHEMSNVCEISSDTPEIVFRITRSSIQHTRTFSNQLPTRNYWWSTGWTATSIRFPETIELGVPFCVHTQSILRHSLTRSKTTI